MTDRQRQNCKFMEWVLSNAQPHDIEVLEKNSKLLQDGDCENLKKKFDKRIAYFGLLQALKGDDSGMIAKAFAQATALFDEDLEYINSIIEAKYRFEFEKANKTRSAPKLANQNLHNFLEFGYTSVDMVKRKEIIQELIFQENWYNIKKFYPKFIDENKELIQTISNELKNLQSQNIKWEERIKEIRLNAQEVLKALEKMGTSHEITELKRKVMILINP